MKFSVFPDCVISSYAGTGIPSAGRDRGGRVYSLGYESIRCSRIAVERFLNPEAISMPILT